ncbi:unnamed protein product [Trichobilharzia szidati]|nr:unnamed protein product [Trichobilharzia szidati]
MQTQHIALALFLVLLAIGAIIIISILIVVKRRIARRKGRVGRTTYTVCGQGLPKVWKSNIEKKINATIKVRTEPQVFGPHYAENYDVYTSSGEVTFLYRAKALDQFLILKQAILSVDSTLEAPPLRDTRDFLLKSRHHVMNPPPSRDCIEEYCRLYLWARHDLNPFGEAEYTRLCELQSSLLQTINLTGSLHHPMYSPAPNSPIAGGGGGVGVGGGQLTSEPIVKVHKRTHSNFKINFPSFLFKATEHSQPRVVDPSVSPTTTTSTAPGPMSTTSSTMKRPTSTHQQQSRPTRIKVLSKRGQTGGTGNTSSGRGSHTTGGGGTVGSSGISLKRLSHSSHRKKHELLVSPTENEKSSLTSSVQLISHPSTHVFTNDMISEHDSNADLSLTVSKGDMTSTTSLSNRRRHSCQSDGSQTALIDLEPIVASSSNPKSSLPSSRPIIKHADTYGQSVESRSSIRYNKGMENEGVNC